MGAYALNATVRLIAKDEEFRARVALGPEDALGDRGLGPEELRALLDGDVAALYARGAHEYLLLGLARFGAFDLDLPTYNRKIREAEPRLVY